MYAARCRVDCLPESLGCGTPAQIHKKSQRTSVVNLPSSVALLPAARWGEDSGINVQHTGNSSKLVVSKEAKGGLKGADITYKQAKGQASTLYVWM